MEFVTVYHENRLLQNGKISAVSFLLSFIHYAVLVPIAPLKVMSAFYKPFSGFLKTADML